MDWLWNLDQELFRAIHLGWHSQWVDPIMWLLSYSGLGQVQGPPILLLVRWKNAWGRAVEDTPEKPGFFRILRYVRWRDFYPWAAPLLYTFALSGISNQVIKRLTSRDRPSNFYWAQTQEQFFGHSFPSGHTVTSFALAFMVLFLTRGRSPWGYIALVWATMVGISRIYRGVHWPTDVLASMFLGLLCTCVVLLLLMRKHAKETQGAETA